MPITRSAKKALRQSSRRRVRNVKSLKAMKDAVKKFRKMAAAKQFSEAKAYLPQVHKALDKAAKRKDIKRNTAARLKSRLSRLVA